jgi:hypothetical protein
MSMFLEDQIITWRARTRPRRQQGQQRPLAAPLLRGLVLAAAIGSALLYFVTRSQTVELVVGLARDAAARETPHRPPTATADKAEAQTDSGAIVVSMRPSALAGKPLQP